MYGKMFAALLTVAKKSKVPKFPSVEGWLNILLHPQKNYFIAIMPSTSPFRIIL